MKRGGTALSESAQASAQGLVTGGRRREAVEQRAQVKAGTAGYDREAPSALNASKGLAGEWRICAGGEFGIDANDIYKVVRDAAARGSRELSGPDIQILKDLNRVAVEDFTLERFGKEEGEFAFAGPGGPDQGNQRPQGEIRVGCHGQRLIG